MNPFTSDKEQLGVQEPPQDYRIFNRRQPDGTFRPLSVFWEAPKIKPTFDEAEEIYLEQKREEEMERRHEEGWL